SGPIDEAPADTWGRLDRALQTGSRRLPGGSTLARLLAERRGVRSRRHTPPLTVKQILRWADAHHKRTGRWPNIMSGPVVGVAGERWGAVNNALYYGCRGLPGQDSLALLLARERGARTGRGVGTS